MCVCVNHLNRCKTSTCRRPSIWFSFSILFPTFFQAGEWSRPAELHLTKLSAVSWGYHWRRPVTYLPSCDHLLFRVCFVFRWFYSPIWQRAKPSTLSTNLFVFDDLVLFLIPTGEVARQFLLIWPTDYSCFPSIDNSCIWVSADTIHSCYHSF